MLNLLESVTGSLRETMREIDDDEQAERQHDAASHDEHLAHRRMLAHRAMVLQQKLDEVSSIAEPTGELSDFLHMSHKEILDIKVRHLPSHGGFRRAGRAGCEAAWLLACEGLDMVSLFEKRRLERWPHARAFRCHLARAAETGAAHSIALGPSA